MPKKTRQSNKKQQNAVQNLLTDNYTEAPPIIESKKTRAKFACNPKLAEFIDIANLLPYEEDKNLQLSLETLYILPPTNLSLGVNTEKETSIDIFERERVALKNLPVEVQSYIKQRMREYEPIILREAKELASDPFVINEKFVWASKILYSSAIVKELFLIRKIFLDFVDVAYFIERQRKNKGDLPLSKFAIPRFYEPGLNSWRKYVNFIPNDNREFLITSNRSVGEIIGISDVDFDEEGNIKFRLSPLAQALQDVNISRLRKCEICGKLFWAARKDAFTCSKQHAKTRRMRLLRQNWKDKGDLYLKARQKKANKKKEK